MIIFIFFTSLMTESLVSHKSEDLPFTTEDSLPTVGNLFFSFKDDFHDCTTDMDSE